MRNNTIREKLEERATALEDEAIATAEGHHAPIGDYPRAATAQFTHAELQLKCAALLRRRALEFV